eukprot:1183347-Prorocentrum_minimum.AAC.1
MNSPVTRPSKFSVRGPHHDMKIEVWAGLLYMREKKDKSTGGALNGTSCTNLTHSSIPRSTLRAWVWCAR